MKRRFGFVAVGSAGLLLGMTLGPPVVHAATAQFVRLQGANGSSVAKVTAKGQLSVTDGTAHTQAGQLEATVASAGQAVTRFSQATCNAGGVYTVPSGKALIITSVVFFNHVTVVGSQNEQDLFIGPAASPCTTMVAAGVSNGETATLPETFSPGIPVPEGDAIGGFKVNDGGSFMIYGYLVPAAEVPAARSQGRQHLNKHGSPTLSH